MQAALVIGTRPEAIKLAPVVRALRRRSLDPVVISTGQHRELLDRMFQEFEITPDIELRTMRPGQKLSDLTARLVNSLGEALRRVQPDYVLVQGDTTSALAGALAAFYEHIPVGHVEAGLRTGNMASPFPEEANRRIVGALATDHFCPTRLSQLNLVAEGVPVGRTHVTGNTVIDALLWTIERSRYRPKVSATGRSRRILLTLHRRENQGPVMKGICDAVRRIVANSDVEVVFPVHPNAAVRKIVQPALSGVEGVRLTEPLDYLSLAETLRDAYLVMTDSGGLQEEGPALGKPVLVLRDTTERPEAITAGVARLVGTDPEKIYRETMRLLEDNEAYSEMAHAINPFGDGHAAERIAVLLSLVTRRLNAAVTSSFNEPPVLPSEPAVTPRAGPVQAAATRR